MNADVPGRFWEKVNREGPVMSGMDTRCWEWTASKDKKGYGKFKLNTMTRAAHRVAFFLATGKEPDVVCHLCHNPSCVRPDHLYAGDNESNVLDAVVHRLRKLKDLA